jgi:hypothetical protein
MERFEGSGLSVLRFCEREGIGASRFYDRRARLNLLGDRGVTAYVAQALQVYLDAHLRTALASSTSTTFTHRVL